MLSTASRSENQLTVRDTAASQSTAGSQPMSVFAREMSAGVPRMSPIPLGHCERHDATDENPEVCFGLQHGPSIPLGSNSKSAAHRRNPDTPDVDLAVA